MRKNDENDDKYLFSRSNTKCPESLRIFEKNFGVSSYLKALLQSEQALVEGRSDSLKAIKGQSLCSSPHAKSRFHSLDFQLSWLQRCQICNNGYKKEIFKYFIHKLLQNFCL